MRIPHGLSAFPITPCGAAGGVDGAALATILERLCAARVDSIGLLGSTGTYAYLSPEVRKQVAELACDIVSNRAPLLIGVGALRTDNAVELARHAAELGATGLFMAMPSYTPLTEREIVAHYQAVAEATDLPLCLYNNPPATHVKFSPDLLDALVALPNVTGAKMPFPVEGDFAAEHAALRARLPAAFTLGYSGDPWASTFLAGGADTWFSVLGGVLPTAAMALAHTPEAHARASVTAALAPLTDLMPPLGTLRVAYALANLLALSDAAPPAPVLPLQTADLDQIAKAVDHLEESFGSLA